MRKLNQLLLEPVNTLTHFVGALASLAGTIWLLALTWEEPAKAAALGVYGLSMVLLYAASTLLHGLKLPVRRRMLLNRLDHAAIFLLIAGTYTPIVLSFFPPSWRWPVLSLIWLAALIGVGYKLISSRIHGFFNVSIYPALSWAGVVPAFLAYRVKPLVPAGGLALLFAGGAIYMLGFTIYYRKRPDPWPQVLGHHEIWHLMVMGGGLFHFLFMILYVVPA